MPTYSYYIEDYGENPQDAIRFESVHSPDCGKSIAEDAAEEGYDNNDLWEYKWPMTFVILDEDDIEIGRYIVRLEAEPVFYAHKKS